MIVVEVGTFAGFSTVHFLPCVAENGGHLYCVDWFKGNPMASGPCEVKGYNTLQVFGRLLENVREYECISVIVGKSLDAARVFVDGSADLVYLAADHRYSGVGADIKAWLPKLRHGGILSGHQMEERITAADPALYEKMINYCEEDYVDQKHYGVIRAVGEANPEANVEEGIFWWVKG